MRKNILFFLSFLTEVAFCAFLYYKFGDFFSVFIFPALIDGIFYLEGRLSLSSLAILVTSFFMVSFFSFSLKYSPTFTAEGDIFFFISLVLSLSFLKEEKNKKKDAQKLYDRLRVSEDKLKEAVESLEQYSSTIEELTLLRERTRISRELHDSAGHALSTISLQIRAIKTLTGEDPKKAKEMLEDIAFFTNNSLENVRRAVRELRPIEFDAFEGIFAIEELVKNFSKLTGIETRMILSKNRFPVTSEQSHQLYQIVKECLSNSMRHGKAKQITISIQFLEDSMYAQIKDNGAGCSIPTEGMGLKGIRERVLSLDGEVQVYTGEGKGFEVAVTLPKGRK